MSQTRAAIALVNERIAEARTMINKQRRIVRDLSKRGRDGQLAEGEEVLSVMLESLRALEEHRRSIARVRKTPQAART
jgi:hypothetical protein